MTTTNQEHDHDLPTFDELFPNGRHIYYEGDTAYGDPSPEEFAAEILAEFGFDPSADADWGIVYEDDERGPGFISYQFFCPPGTLEAIYGSGRWRLGS
jgi:hypothetical protein